MPEKSFAIKKTVYWRKEKDSFLFLHPQTRKLIIIGGIDGQGISSNGVIEASKKNSLLVKILKKNGVIEPANAADFKIDHFLCARAMAPLNVTIQITNCCNLNCIHCHNDKTRNKITLDFETIKDLVGQLAEMRAFNINLSGGEPTLVPGIEKIVKCVSDAGLNCTMSTNATLMTDELALKLAAAGLRQVNISLDSFEARSHNAIRGTENAFQLMRDHLGFFKKQDIGYTFVTTLFRQTLDDYSKTIDLAYELGAQSHKTNTVIPQGRAKLRDLGVLENIAGYIKIWENKRRDLKGKMNLLLETMCMIQAGLDYISPEGVPKIIDCGCPAGILTCGINEKGDVQPCSFFTEFSAGNIYKDSFNNIWNGTAMQKIRDRENFDVCGKCDFKKRCGGCRARSYGMYGVLGKNDPACFLLNK